MQDDIMRSVFHHHVNGNWKLLRRRKVRGRVSGMTAVQLRKINSR